MLRKVRTLLAALVVTAITLLFLDFTGTLHTWLSWLASIQLLPAILSMNFVIVAALILLTLVFGRIYCSVICPLGIFQDLLARLNHRRNKYSYSPAVSWLRYAMLAVMAVALVAGVGTVVQLLAPYSSYGRIATMLLQPLWQLCNNALAFIAERADSYAFYSVDVWIKSLPVLIVAAVTLVVLVILSWRGGRTYCNTICPVGTLLSFFARFSWLKIRFDADKCRDCSLCSKNCKAACIDYKTHTVDYARCVVCGNCISSCQFGALQYNGANKTNRTNRTNRTNGTNRANRTNRTNRANGTNRTNRTNRTNQPTNPQTSQPAQKPHDASKRSFLLATALATTAAIAQKKEKLMDGGLAEIEDKVAPRRQTPLTPPGSLSAQNMATRCTGCQLCVSECPNHVLRPSTDLMHLMQPTMSYERGFCRPECTRCSDVCPTGAIKPLDDIEKSSVQIGHAVFIKKNCVAVTDGVACGNCARHCPAGAIEMVPLDADDPEGAMVPAVNEQACIGCGACEYVCPARPFSAIMVEGHEVHKYI